MLLRDLLTNEFVRLLIDSVKDNGWLTQISDEVGIGRGEFSCRGLANMKLHRVLRLLVGVCEHHCRRSPREWFVLWAQLGKVVYDMADDHYYEMIDERRKRKD